MPLGYLRLQNLHLQVTKGVAQAMAQEIYERVVAHPQYAELTRKRSRFALVLSFIVLAVFYAFVALATLAPASFAAPVTEGLTWPLGLVAGFVIQIFAFVMTGVYVRRANGEFDAINRRLIEEASR